MRWTTTLSLLTLLPAWLACGGKGGGQGGQGRTQQPDTAFAAKQLHRLDDGWQHAITTRDTVALQGIYADDAVLLTAGAPPIEGRDRILGLYRTLFHTRGFSLTFESRSMRVAEGAMMAYDLGSYSLKMQGKNGESIQDQGSYLAVWRKVDGRWRVEAQALSSSRPPGEGVVVLKPS